MPRILDSFESDSKHEDAGLKLSQSVLSPALASDLNDDKCVWCHPSYHRTFTFHPLYVYVLPWCNPCRLFPGQVTNEVKYSKWGIPRDNFVMATECNNFILHTQSCTCAYYYLCICSPFLKHIRIWGDSSSTPSFRVAVWRLWRQVRSYFAIFYWLVSTRPHFVLRCESWQVSPPPHLTSSNLLGFQ